MSSAVDGYRNGKSENGRGTTTKDDESGKLLGENDVSDLKRFPFWNSVAEHDYRKDSARGYRSVTEASRTLSPTDYFVDPIDSSGYETTLVRLRGREHCFVYGERGAGKTTLRYVLESHVRSRPDGTLVVTHKVDDCLPYGVDIAKHFECMARALTADLLIQIVEQFSSTELPSPKQDQALGVLLRAFGMPIRRVVGHLATDKDEQQSKIWGFAELWQRLDRPVVRPVRRSKRLQAWAEDLYSQWTREHYEQLPSGRDSWLIALDTARLWGFHEVLVLVDAEHTIELTTRSIQSLLDNLDAFEIDGVYLKFFLPLDLKTPVEGFYSKQSRGKELGSRKIITLEWGLDDLGRLLRERFRAVGSSRVGFADFDRLERIEDLDTFLLEEAKGSPRKLLVLTKQIENLADEESFTGEFSVSTKEQLAELLRYNPVLAYV